MFMGASQNKVCAAENYQQSTAYWVWWDKKWSRVCEISRPDDPEAPDTAKVLVMCTGGTIGMIKDGNVYKPAPTGYLLEELRSMKIFHDKKFEEIQSGSSVGLVLPQTGKDRRILYTLFEYEPLLDSSNMAQSEWQTLAKDIKKHYDEYDGFVILIGTDTMAYAAAAMSFMIENLGKSVIFTGAQIPIFETRSDGRDNFIGALVLAGHYEIPEVCIYFNNKLFRGNRTTKIHPQSFCAFSSPNLEPLADMGTGVQVNGDIIRNPSESASCQVNCELSHNVGILHLYPGITKTTVEQLLQPPLEGVVILTFGAGNGPNNQKDILELFRKASTDGMVFVNVTQCIKGSVSASYECGKALLDAGILPGGDMTTEAAFTKLCYVLAKTNDPGERKDMMLSNLRGEMTQVSSSQDYQQSKPDYTGLKPNPHCFLI